MLPSAELSLKEVLRMHTSLIDWLVIYFHEYLLFSTDFTLGSIHIPHSRKCQLWKKRFFFKFGSPEEINQMYVSNLECQESLFGE